MTIDWAIAPIRDISLSPDDTDEAGYLGGFKLAGGFKRTLSFTIDTALCLVLPALLAAWLTKLQSHRVVDPYSYSANTMVGPDHSTAASVVTVILILLNAGVLGGLTGQTVGKKVLGLHQAVPVNIRGIGPAFAYCGVARSIARIGLHFFDFAVWGYGFLRGAWHPRRQTWSDQITGVVVIDGPITLRQVS